MTTVIQEYKDQYPTAGFVCITNMPKDTMVEGWHLKNVDLVNGRSLPEDATTHTVLEGGKIVHLEERFPMLRWMADYQSDLRQTRRC